MIGGPRELAMFIAAGSCTPDVRPLFIALCGSCHGATIHGDRDQYEQHFTEMIEGYYGGRCYLTKEEFVSVCGGN